MAGLYATVLFDMCVLYFVCFIKSMYEVERVDRKSIYFLVGIRNNGKNDHRALLIYYATDYILLIHQDSSPLKLKFNLIPRFVFLHTENRTL